MKCDECFFRDTITRLDGCICRLCVIDCTDMKSLSSAYKIMPDVYAFICKYGCARFKPVATTLKIGDRL